MITDLEAATLVTISELCELTFRMRDIIMAIIADRGGAVAPPDSVRHWMLLDDACAHLIDCIEKTAEYESKRAPGKETYEFVDLERRLQAELAQQDLLQKDHEIE